MGRFFALVLGIAALTVPWRDAEAQKSWNAFRWEKDKKHVALFNGDQVIWQFNFDPKEDKPYFHPLRTPAGLDMTLERPADHPWHRGLWFSWKDINGVNYWEEDPAKGVSSGRSLIKAVKTTLDKHTQTANIAMRLVYADSANTVLNEKREVVVSQPENGGYTVSWYHEFEAVTDVRLYLEKPAKYGGVEWGGYAGLSFRGSDQLKQPTFVASSGWSTQADLTGYGEKERWMGITALNNGKPVALVIFDHPDNERHPSPWYIWHAAGHNLFFTPSLLFDGPLALKKGEKLRLKYRVWVTDGEVDADAIEAQYRVFAQE
ncbi:DUF6807 domain-containing protein [Parapedobacter koreensis]|uniref:Methane oxygenase PmoA n=1 Tax=Parapedobacter koreensis TaxID=332977 RepID=A0A1H7QMQ6_9SPHI|nr:PmoA family protein [Parapedobacter koreensis]SEL49149.1 Methane oxygenase PmoA [Parapedobacter koreensis]